MFTQYMRLCSRDLCRSVRFGLHRFESKRKPEVGGLVGLAIISKSSLIFFFQHDLDVNFSSLQFARLRKSAFFHIYLAWPTK